eukprot:1160859-Pelagomonas_calceolata.AAC.17
MGIAVEIALQSDAWGTEQGLHLPVPMIDISMKTHLQAPAAEGAAGTLGYAVPAYQEHGAIIQES